MSDFVLNRRGNKNIRLIQKRKDNFADVFEYHHQVLGHVYLFKTIITGTAQGGCFHTYCTWNVLLGAFGEKHSIVTHMQQRTILQYNDIDVLIGTSGARRGINGMNSPR